MLLGRLRLKYIEPMPRPGRRCYSVSLFLQKQVMSAHLLMRCGDLILNHYYAGHGGILARRSCQKDSRSVKVVDRLVMKQLSENKKKSHDDDC